MSLKIKDNISLMKINGYYIKQAKINGYIIYETSSRMATEWLDYNNPNFDGASRLRDNLDAWIYNTSGTTINGVYLDLVAEKPCEFKMTADYYGYYGCPRKYCVFILNSDNNDEIVDEHGYLFDQNGTLTTRETTFNLNKSGNYKVVIGSDRQFEFGVKIKQISLTELQSN